MLSDKSLFATQLMESNMVAPWAAGGIDRQPSSSSSALRDTQGMPDQIRLRRRLARAHLIPVTIIITIIVVVNTE
jgi:hypothetical protein